jgi:hypothetical protein
MNNQKRAAKEDVLVSPSNVDKDFVHQAKNDNVNLRFGRHIYICHGKDLLPSSVSAEADCVQSSST